MVSVIIPNFNRSAYLKQAIHSVINQNFQKWELLIVDDGSTDDSESMVLLLGKNDDRIKWIPRNSGLKGASACRNIGLLKAKSDFVVFLDSDDLLAPNCLEQRMHVMENSSWDFAVFPMLIFNRNWEDAKYLWNVETTENDVDRFLKLDAVWQTTGPIWGKQFLIDLGGFDERLNCWQDVDIHIRALLTKPNYKKYYELPPDCFYRRNSENSISQQEISSRAKLNSRYLLAQKLYQLVPTKKDIKYIYANVLISALLVMRAGFFIKGYFWSLRRQIFNDTEYFKLIELSIIILFRLDRLGFFKVKKNLLLQRLVLDNTMGKIKHETTN